MSNKSDIHKVMVNEPITLSTWALRVFLIIILISGLIHINENPIFISILAIIILLILWRNKYDGEYLILKAIGVVFRKQIWLFWKDDDFIDFNDISLFSVRGEYTIELDNARKMIPGSQHIEPNEIDIQYNNGNTKTIKLNIYKNQLVDFVDLANTMINSIK